MYVCGSICIEFPYINPIKKIKQKIVSINSNRNDFYAGVKTLRFFL